LGRGGKKEEGGKKKDRWQKRKKGGKRGLATIDGDPAFLVRINFFFLPNTASSLGPKRGEGKEERKGKKEKAGEERERGRREKGGRGKEQTIEDGGGGGCIRLLPLRPHRAAGER